MCTALTAVPKLFQEHNINIFIIFNKIYRHAVLGFDALNTSAAFIILP
jgi:hypothetical protein